MAAIITLPGFRGSGETHWQTLWEAEDPSMARFWPASWDRPDLGDWIAALDRVVLAAPEPPLLVAHSIACLLVAHWAAYRKGAGAGPRTEAWSSSGAARARRWASPLTRVASGPARMRAARRP